MSEGPPELRGPDLAEGIPSTDLAEGGTLLGHARGEPVLLARRNGVAHAIGATCAHYGGPLAEGTIVGGTVRCPWHHACFSVRTGEAERAPALSPVPCYEVVEREGTVRVGGTLAPEKPAAPPESPESIVIVGGGAAGNAAAESLRSAGYAGTVTLVSADPYLPCDRPNLSKDYLAGNAPEEWIPLRSKDFYAEKAIDLRLDTRVERIDPAGRSVLLGDGTTLRYGALLLATGAEPNRLRIPGADAPHVFTLRTLADSRALIHAASGSKRAVVIGAGFIGLETAASLRARGLDVAVVAPDDVPLGRVVGKDLGAEIRKIHEERGVRFQLGARPSAIEASGVVLESGVRLEADLVVAGIGVTPATGLAERAGLRVEGGIVVDDRLRTSVPGIFAAGDLARWPDARTRESIRVEHWVVAERQGKTAARNMLGFDEPFDAVPFFWSAHYDVTISYVGHAPRWDRIDVAGSVPDRDCAVAFRRGGTTLAVATMGRDVASLEAEAAMERRDEEALRALVPAS